MVVVTQDIFINFITKSELKGVQSFKEALNNINDKVLDSQKRLALLQDSTKSFDESLKKVNSDVFINQKRLSTLNEISRELNIPINKVSRSIEDLNMGFDEQARVINKSTGDVMGFGQVLNAVSHNTQRFRMELLGVMFFGMGMTRMFNDLFGPAFKSVGLFDLLSTALQIFFLPVAIMLTEALLPILKWFMDAPVSIRIVVGAFTLLFGAIGFLLTTIGSMGLGLTSLSSFFSWFSTPAGLALKKTVGSVAASFKDIMGLGFTAARTSFNTFVAAVKGTTGLGLTIDVAIVMLGLAVGAAIGAWFLDNVLAPMTKGLKDKPLELPFNIKWYGFRTVAESFDMVGTLMENELEIWKFAMSLGIKFVLGGLTYDDLQAGLNAVLGSIVLSPLKLIIDVNLNWVSMISEFVGGADAFFKEKMEGVYGLEGPPTGYSGEWVGAKGGIVTSPTRALIGEAGPEAVIPLDGSGNGININYTVNMNNTLTDDMDVERLKDMLSEDFVRNMTASVFRR